MKKPIFLVLAALGLAIAVPVAQAGNAACSSREDVVRKLADRFGETRTGVGLHREDAVVEMFSSPATGTWTLVVTRADGMSCLLAAGQRWEQFPAAVLRVPGGEEV